MINIMLISALF